MTTVEYRHDKPPTLKEAQAAVGGYVELVPLMGERQMLCNEDGIRMGLEVNREACKLTAWHHVIRGNVLVLCGPARWS